MENVIALHEKMSDDEIIKDIYRKLNYLSETQEGILTQQEILHIRSLKIEELHKEILENQKEMRKNINVLLERVK